MIKRKKILSIVCLCSIFVSSTLFPKAMNVQAKTKSDNKINISTSQVPESVSTFASAEFPKQLNSISSNPSQYGFNKDEVQAFKLGQAFSVYYLKNNKVSDMKGYYYPVLYNNEIKGIFAVIQNSNGQFTSTLTKSFADKLNSLKSDNFSLINVNGNLFAVGSSKFLLIHKSLNKTTGSSASLTSSQIREINKLIKNKNPRYIYINIVLNIPPLSPELTPWSNINIYPNNKPNRTNTNTSVTPVSKKLPVPIILQGDHPWCWAATSASLIDYDKSTNITEEDVVNYTFGKLTNDGGTPTQIMNAYKHWGLNPVMYNNPLTYNSVVSYINNNDPINSLMYYDDGNSYEGHSMSLIGYSTLSNGYKSYTMIDPNENYYVSVAATNTGNNVEYDLGGDEFVWYQTIVPRT
ncbi:papain-like cysteine protease family protein [Clostridium hydrogenum]|uniref:papain-like cysteine protease family protein n=1 Tax=Clostridium hydrogenum TaxID=2855764 RepID=UPI001F303EAB|nr:papain-like cysteine protease family protein [Clostridium hydrogenum]